MRRAARRLLLLALVLFGVAWLLVPYWDPQRPTVSVVLVLTFCGGWTAGVAGAARAVNPEVWS